MNINEYNGNVHSSENQQILRKLVDVEVIHNVGQTIAELSRHDAEEVCNISVKDDWEETAAQYLGNKTNFATEHKVLFNLSREEALQHLKDNDGAQDWCESNNLDPYQSEALEYWAVSSFMAEYLKKRGEMVGDILDFHVWGRTCSGQAIMMDSVVAEIALDMEILVGQKNSWEVK